MNRLPLYPGKPLAQAVVSVFSACRSRGAALLLATSWPACVALPAAVLNVDFSAPGSPTFVGQGAFRDAADNSAVAPLFTFWNPVTVPTTLDLPGATGGLLLSDGTTRTGVTVTFTGALPAQDFATSTIPPAQGFDLMRDGASADGQVGITGLIPATRYLVVLYGRSSDPSRPVGTNFTFGGRVAGAFVSTFQSVTGADANPATTTLTQKEDYTITTARTDSTGALRLNYFVGTLNGFQIVGEFDTQTFFGEEVPATLAGTSDAIPYELGFSFRPKVAGQVLAVRDRKSVV